MTFYAPRFLSVAFSGVFLFSTTVAKRLMAALSLFARPLVSEAEGKWRSELDAYRRRPKDKLFVIKYDEGFHRVRYCWLPVFVLPEGPSGVRREAAATSIVVPDGGREVGVCAGHDHRPISSRVRR